MLRKIRIATGRGKEGKTRILVAVENRGEKTKVGYMAVASVPKRTIGAFVEHHFNLHR